MITIIWFNNGIFTVYSLFDTFEYFWGGLIPNLLFAVALYIRGELEEKNKANKSK